MVGARCVSGEREKRGAWRLGGVWEARRCVSRIWFREFHCAACLSFHSASGFQECSGHVCNLHHCVERASRMSPQNVRLKRPRSRPFPVRVGLRGRMRTGPSRTSKSAAPHGHPAGSRVSQRDALHPSTPLRVDRETTLGHRQLHPDVSHMRRVSPPRVSLYSILGCELKKAHSAPAASSSTHAVLVPLGWPEDDSQYKIGKTSRGAV